MAHEGPRPQWHRLAGEAVAGALDVSLATGLTSEEAARRLQESGPNLLPQARPPGPLRLLAAQFASILIYLLLVAALVSFVLGDSVEAGAILAIIALNGLLGFGQEYRAERALLALRSLVSPEPTVLRDGARRPLPLAEVVPGDVLLLEPGDVVAADARIVEATGLRCGEALLTGESTPVDKSPEPVDADAVLADRRSMVYQGTQVVHGRGTAVTVATGASTEVGKIATLIASPKQEQTPLQRRLEEVGRWLVFGALALCGFVFVVGLARGFPADEMLLTAASLAVAAIPEGLPAATTIVLALGVQRMVGRNVIVRRLSAVETLGSATVVYTDKTGTLTENRMQVQELWAPGNEAEALRIAVLCNNATLGDGDSRDTGDPTEVALLAYARDQGIDIAEMERRCRRESELPFEAARARMTVILRAPDGQRLAFVKGAPETLIPLSSVASGSDAPSAALERATAMAAAGMRVLALAERRLGAEATEAEVERDLTLVGLIGMADPLRPEARDAIARARQAGVRTVVLTGDHPETAAAIGRSLGLGDRVVFGRDLATEGLPEGWTEADVFARVTSEDKLRIVQAARQRGEVAAMTGDGVNDAPALRAANIGVAMGLGGTDVAREASDMVLLDNNFDSIVAAIEEGRAIFDNIRRFVHFLLSCNVGELVVVFLALVVAGVSPLTPLQLLFVNLLTDGLPALALGVEPAAADIMRRPPRPPKASILSARSLTPVLGLGSLVAAAALIAFALGQRWGGAPLGGDMAFATLVCAQLAASVVFRSETRSAVGLGRNLWHATAVVSSLALLALVFGLPFLRTPFHVSPLSEERWLVVAGLSLLPLVAGEALKSTGLVGRLGLTPE